jgi:hypothetical protein
MESDNNSVSCIKVLSKTGTFKIKGNSISFLTTPPPESGIPNMTFKFKGKVDGDKVKMTFTVKRSPLKGPSRVIRV